MKEINSTATNPFDRLCEELIVAIFMFLNVAELATLSTVCKSFNRLVRGPLLWHRLDLTKLNNYLLGAWDDEHSSTKLIQLLNYILNLSNGVTNCLVFNYYIYLTDEQLIFIAERTPNLKRLVLPSSGNLSRVGIKKAMKLWNALESITITSIFSQLHIFSAIVKYGNNITQIKFTSDFQEYHADALIKYTPNLTTLSIRFITVSMKALTHVFKFMQHLKVVNICHSPLMDRTDTPSCVVVYRIRDLRNYLDITSLEKLIVCYGDWCLRCKNGCDTTPSRQPYGPIEDIWREDEIPSLAH